MSIMDDIEPNDLDHIKARLESALDWAGENSWFDDKFLVSLNKQVKGGRDLSYKQLEAFERIEEMIDRKIEQDEDKMGDDY